MTVQSTTSVGCASCHAGKKAFLLVLTLLLCAPAQAQSNDSLVILFETARDLRLALGDNASLWRQNNRRDINNDGKNDLTLVQEDAAGNPEAFLVYYNVNGVLLDSATVSWSTIVDALGGQEPTRFMGFFPFFGGDLKDAVFRGEGGLAIIGIPVSGGKQAGSSMRTFRLAADQATVADLDDDGTPELIVRNRDTRTVQVWGGAATSTATEGEIEAALVRLFQNYPNPFRDRTTIAYEVEQPGPVTITVYDLLGRRVRTLVDGDQPVGAYQVEWDGHDAGGQPVASGTYFYRLRVGEAVSSKQAIRVR